MESWIERRNESDWRARLLPSRNRGSAGASPSKGITMSLKIWIDGKLLDKADAKISVYDHGLLYGDGVFEGIRVYQGRIFKCQQHMDRLYRCAEEIALKIPITSDEMVTVQRQCIEANNITEGYIRLVVTRGYGTLGLDPRKCPVPGIICIADQIRLYAPEFYETGMKVVVAKRPKTPVACLDPRIKTLNYL